MSHQLTYIAFLDMHCGSSRNVLDVYILDGYVLPFLATPKAFGK
jgi:hypothetical protein